MRQKCVYVIVCCVWLCLCMYVRIWVCLHVYACTRVCVRTATQRKRNTEVWQNGNSIETQKRANGQKETSPQHTRQQEDKWSYNDKRPQDLKNRERIRHVWKLTRFRSDPARWPCVCRKTRGEWGDRQIWRDEHTARCDGIAAGHHPNPIMRAWSSHMAHNMKTEHGDAQKDMEPIKKQEMREPENEWHTRSTDVNLMQP